jgi:hypothetical protein
MKSLGIDFGTTNTAVAFYDDSDPERKIISIPYHGAAALLMKKTVPSVVFFDKSGKPSLFGEEALNAGKEKPHLLVDKIKRVIGKTYEEVKDDPLLKNIAYELVKGDVISAEGKAEQHVALVRVGEVEKLTYRPEEIVAIILKEAKTDAETYLQQEHGYENLDFDWITLTFPANFNQNQRAKIIEAAVLAGFEEKKLKFVNEPTAAAFDAVYEGKTNNQTKNGSGKQKNSKRQEVLVLNIGSGTTDLALVEMKAADGDLSSTRADTTVTGGDSALGGTDMDIEIVNWVLGELKKDPNVNTNLFTKAGRQLLRFEAEDAKISISEGRCEETWVKIPGFGVKGPLLTKRELNNIVKPIIDKCRLEFNAILAKRKVHDEDYCHIILTGGPMAMGLVRDMITGDFLAPVFCCPTCRKQLQGAKPSDDMLANCTGLPEDKLAIAKTDAWWYTHDSENKPDSDDCVSHLIFSDSSHYELTNKGTGGKLECKLVNQVELQPRNHSIVEDVDPMMCVARGAAISPKVEYTSVLPHAIRILVKGEQTPQVLKCVIELNKQLPAIVHNSWTVLPWESNLAISIIQDKDKETKYDADSDSYYGAFTHWGDCSHCLNPSKEDKNVYIGVNILTSEGERIELFIFEQESDFANWLADPEKYKGTPLLFKQQTDEITVTIDNGNRNPEVARVWAALRAQSPSLFRLMTDTYQLVSSAASLQKGGFRISEETTGLVNKAGPLMYTIYCYMDDEVEKLAKQKLPETELNVQVKSLVAAILACRQYADLSEIMNGGNWEANMAHLKITVDAVNMLVTGIQTVLKQANVLDQQGKQIRAEDAQALATLKSLLSSDLQFFKNIASRKDLILLKSPEGDHFIECQHRVEALAKLVEYYTK